MKIANRILLPAFALVLSGCASSSRDSSAPAPALLSPGDLVASLTEVANGRNGDLSETGLVLKTIELKLVVGRERSGGAHASVLVLDAEGSRRVETSFVQSFTLELPPPERHRAAAETIGAALPAVAEFVDAAIAAARELRAAAARAGLPQKLREMELTAKIVRTNRIEGGISFTGIGPARFGGGTSRSFEEANTVRLVFVAR